jgi:hypothetical protein
VETAAIEVAAGKAMLTIELTLLLPIHLAAIELVEATAASWRHGPDVMPVKATASATANSRVELLHRAKPHVAAGACCRCLRQSLVLQTPDAGGLATAPIVGAAPDGSEAIHGIADLWLLITLRAPAPISNEEVALLLAKLLLAKLLLAVLLLAVLLLTVLLLTVLLLTVLLLLVLFRVVGPE